MQEYEKAGYLTSGFRFFHIKDREQREFSYHYHDFHKILILLGGDVTYCVEGRSYALLPRDIVLIHAGEVHRPVIHSGCVYDRMILYVSPGFLARMADTAALLRADEAVLTAQAEKLGVELPDEAK